MALLVLRPLPLLWAARGTPDRLDDAAEAGLACSLVMSRGPPDLSGAGRLDDAAAAGLASSAAVMV